MVGPIKRVRASWGRDARLLASCTLVAITATFMFSGTAFAYSWEGAVWPNQPSSGCCLILHPTEHATASFDITGWSDGAHAWNADHNANYGLDFSGTMPQIS